MLKAITKASAIEQTTSTDTPSPTPVPHQQSVPTKAMIQAQESAPEVKTSFGKYRFGNHHHHSKSRSRSRSQRYMNRYIPIEQGRRQGKGHVHGYIYEYSWP